jgi:hypothetical protein
VAIITGLLFLEILEARGGGLRDKSSARATRNEFKILFSIPFEHMIFNKFLENKVIHES